MAMELIVTGVIGFVILGYIYLNWNYSYWKKRGVPQHPKQFPGAGDMKDVLLKKKSHNYLLTEIYQKFAGHKVVGYYRLRKPALLVRDPKLIKTVLVNDFSNFHDNYIYIDEKADPIVAKNPFAARGSEWRKIRQQITPAFTTAKFKTLFPLVKQNYKYLNEYINEHLGQNIEAKQLAAMFAVDNVASVAYGIEGGSFNEDTQQLYKHGVEAVGHAVGNPLLVMLLFIFPNLASLLRLRIIPETSVNYLGSLIKQTKEYRLKNNVNRNDYLQILFNLQKEAQKNGQEYSHEDIIAHSMTFFVDGFETSSAVASFALYEMALNPDLQEKLREECMLVVLKGIEIDYDTLCSLPYLDKVTSETLRKYPGFALNRICTADTTLEVDGKYIPIEKGTVISVSIYGLHHDPEYFENPDVFNPERFSEENLDMHPLEAFLPFSAGPRICLGMKFGLLQIKSFIYNVISNYRVLRCEKTTDNLVLDKHYFMAKSVDGLWIKLEKL